jgi:hypothetical protein
MGRRKKVAEIQVYTAPVRPMTLRDALRHLPDDRATFDKLRYRWRDVVRLCPALTGAQRQIGQVICDQFLNRMPNHPWRYCAWPSYDKLAAASACDRRTVASALKELSRIGLLVVEKGAGVAGVGGRTCRMTIRIDRLAEFEQAYSRFLDEAKARSQARLYGMPERHENISEKTGNLSGKEVKNGHPTPLKYILSESLSSDRYPSATSTSRIYEQI